MPPRLASFVAIVADEVNVKDVRLLAVDAPEAASYGVSQRLTVNARAAGPRLGKDVQLAIKGSKSGDWSVADDGTVTAGGLALVEGEYALETVAGSSDEDSALGDAARAAASSSSTPRSRPSSRPRAPPATWSARSSRPARTRACEVSDRISLTITGPDATLAAARTHEALIADETLATAVSYVDAAEVKVEVEAARG